MKPHWIAALALAGLIAGCTDTGTEDPAASASAGAAGAEASANAGAGGVGDIDSLEYFEAVVGDRVFFATDRFSLDGEAQRTLARQADWLKRNPGMTLRIEGHADERGTREYNLALGARRANAARNFLVGEGVSASRIETLSYGKERPVSLCSEERCWSENRRAVTVVIGAPAS